MRIHSQLKKKCSAFAITEVLIVFMVLAMMATMAMPTFSSFIAREKVNAVSRALLTAFSYARAEAMRRGKTIIVCRSDQLGQCITSAYECNGAIAEPDNWQCGWSIGMYSVGKKISAKDWQLIRQQSSFNGVTVKAHLSAFIFRPPAGQVIGLIGNIEISTHRIKNLQGKNEIARCLRIGMAGRIRNTEGKC